MAKTRLTLVEEDGGQYISVEFSNGRRFMLSDKGKLNVRDEEGVWLTILDEVKTE